MEQQIAPGEQAMVEVAAGTLMMDDGTGTGNMVPFTGTLSITEVPPDLTPAALPENLLPDLVVTIQPGEMEFTTPAPLTLPNRAGWGPGTVMDLWSINPTTGLFDLVGTGEVPQMALRLKPLPAESTTPPGTSLRPLNSKTLRIKAMTSFAIRAFSKNPVGASSVAMNTGSFIETHNMVSYQSQGSFRGLTITVRLASR